MSDSIPAKKRAGRKQGSSPFVALSLALHIGGLGLLTLYTPAREALFGKAQPDLEPEVRLEGDALADLTEQIRDINREQLLASVMDLHAIHEEMEDMRVEKAEEFSEIADQRADEQLAKLDSVLVEVTAAQKSALEQQRQATEKTDDKEPIRNAAAQQQSAAESGQQTLTDILEYARAAEPLKTRQDAANAAQVEATRALAKVRQAAASGRSAQSDLKNKQDAQAREQQSQANEQKSVEDGRAKASEAQQRVDASKVAEQVKQEAVKTAQATSRPTEKTAARAYDDQVKSAKEEARKAQEELRRAEQNQKNVAGDLQRREGTLAKVEEKLKQATDAVTSAEQTLKERDQQFGAKFGEAVSLQEKANELQKASTDAVQQALAGGMKAGAQGAVARRSLDSLQLYDASIGEMYEYLVKAEKDIAQSYGEFRATDLAMLTGVSPKRAMQQIDIPESKRPQIDVEITKQKVTEGEQYKRHAEAVKTAVRESESIVTAAENLLDSARRTQARYGEGTSVALGERSRRLAEINRASHEEQGGQAVDLSALMRQQAAAAEGEPEQKKPTPRPSARMGVPPQVRDVDVTAPARTIVSGAPGAKWTFVDSWYTIGPFPNPGRANIHRVFPPESSANLDAVYSGMFGPVKWQFIQSPGPKVSPANAVEYGIWYAYTELKFDEECDLWIAVGSDDRSDIWINDVRVWSSSDVLKGWQIGEGLRKVHFAKGRNRILYRIENGWNETGFSMCIYTGGE